MCLSWSMIGVDCQYGSINCLVIWAFFRYFTVPAIWLCLLGFIKDLLISGICCLPLTVKKHLNINYSLLFFSPIQSLQGGLTYVSTFIVCPNIQLLED